MAQYIHVYMDNEKDNYKSKGLRDIIVFIGEQSNKGKKDLSQKDAYKRGKKIINSRLRKWHMTTINRLVSADKGKLPLNYDQKVSKPIWKIHRSKAQKVFSAIRNILKGYKNSKVLETFDEICKKYSFDSGADAVGSPYYGVIRQKDLLVAQRYSDTDIKALLTCAERIEEFSKYH